MGGEGPAVGVHDRQQVYELVLTSKSTVFDTPARRARLLVRARSARIRPAADSARSGSASRSRAGPGRGLCGIVTLLRLVARRDVLDRIAACRLEVGEGGFHFGTKGRLTGRQQR